MERPNPEPSRLRLTLLHRERFRLCRLALAHFELRLDQRDHRPPGAETFSAGRISRPEMTENRWKRRRPVRNSAAVRFRAFTRSAQPPGSHARDNRADRNHIDGVDARRSAEQHAVNPAVDAPRSRRFSSTPRVNDRRPWPASPTTSRRSARRDSHHRQRRSSGLSAKVR